jgi:hypothetical protein
MRKLHCLALLGAAALITCGPLSSPGNPTSRNAVTQPLAIVGGTLVDLADHGNSSRDVRDAVVFIEGDKIVAAGLRSEVWPPRGARFIDAQGGYIVPGFIDGFAAHSSQAFANAYLYMGVTSVVTSLPVELSQRRRPDARRGPTFATADPSPRLFFLESLSKGREVGREGLLEVLPE